MQEDMRRTLFTTTTKSTFKGSTHVNKTFFLTKLILVGLQFRRSFQEKATTFEGAELFQIEQKTTYSDVLKCTFGATKSNNKV